MRISGVLYEVSLAGEGLSSVRIKPDGAVDVHDIVIVNMPRQRAKALAPLHGERVTVTIEPEAV